MSRDSYGNEAVGSVAGGGLWRACEDGQTRTGRALAFDGSVTRACNGDGASAWLAYFLSRGVSVRGADRAARSRVSVSLSVSLSLLLSRVPTHVRGDTHTHVRARSLIRVYGGEDYVIDDVRPTLWTPRRFHKCSSCGASSRRARDTRRLSRVGNARSPYTIVGPAASRAMLCGRGCWCDDLLYPQVPVRISGECAVSPLGGCAAAGLPSRM